VTFLLIPILYQTTIHGNNVFACPNGDFLELSGGTASIVTDHIDRFLTDGILLKSGKALKADYYYSNRTRFISIWWSQNSTGFAAI
jgi:hypothetical protein